MLCQLRLATVDMKRFSKKRIAVGVVLVGAMAVPVGFALYYRGQTVPLLRFLEGRVPEIDNFESLWGGPGGTLYSYSFEADFDSVAEAAAQELTAEGFALTDNRGLAEWIDDLRSVQYRKADHSVVIEAFVNGAQQTERVHVQVWVPHEPSFWQRLISKTRETLGL